MSEALLDRILTELQALRAGQDELRAGQDELRARVDRLQGSQDLLRIDVMARIDRLQETVSAMREDVGVNFARADVAGRSVVQFRHELTGTTTALRNDLEAMNEFLIAVERKVRRLSTQFDNFQQERDLGGSQPNH
jgi:outer membrane murein-binding lipoprotein Lpp